MYVPTLLVFVRLRFQIESFSIRTFFLPKCVEIKAGRS